MIMALVEHEAGFAVEPALAEAVLHAVHLARVALHAAEQDPLEVVRRHELVERRRDPLAGSSG